ncbi:MAG: flagellar assembly protein FliW [Chlamydiales bacterium]|jgi:flagellar assembly factor FliW|nr:flagellar assembly protein FliW [Chlamydiales bacterium]
MQEIRCNLIEGMPLQHTKSIHFPNGLPAFEFAKEFVLLTNEEEEPFLWLQSVILPNLAFVTIDPFLIYPDYKADISDDDVSFLKLEKEEDAFLLAIVNVRNNEDEGITANLVSPIVINNRSKIGKQVILQNHLRYSVRYRIN